MAAPLNVQALVKERDHLSRDLERTRLIVDELMTVRDHLNDEISSLKAILEDARDDATGLSFVLYCASFPLFSSPHMISISVASRKLEVLQAIAQGVMDQIKPRGVTLEGCLMNTPEWVKGIALNGVRHGAALALALAQPYSDHDLRRLIIKVPNRGDPVDLPSTEDFSFVANTVATFSSARDIVNK